MTEGRDRIVLGHLLAHPEALAETSQVLFPADFSEKYGYLYSTLIGSTITDGVVNLNHIAAGMSSRYGVDIDMIAAELANMRASAGEHFATHVAAMVNEAKVKALNELAENLSRASTAGSDADVMANEFVQQISLVRERQAYRVDVDSTKDLGDRFFKRFDALNDTENPPPPPMGTGIDPLNDLLNGGFRDGKYIVVGANSGEGKSALAMQIASTIAMHYRPAMFLSLEMPADDLFDRLIASEACVNYSTVQNGTATGQDMQDISNAVAKYRDNRSLTINSPINKDYRHLVTIVRNAVENDGIKFVVVDYLQLCGGVKRDTAGYALVSQAFRDLGAELGVTIMMLSQMNRDVAKRTDKKPINSDLLGTSELENNGDLIILLYRHSRYYPACTTPDHIQLCITKNRSGPQGEVDCRFDGARLRFHEWCDMDPEPDLRLAQSLSQNKSTYGGF